MKTFSLEEAEGKPKRRETFTLVFNVRDLKVSPCSLLQFGHGFPVHLFFFRKKEEGKIPSKMKMI